MKPISQADIYKFLKDNSDDFFSITDVHNITEISKSIIKKSLLKLYMSKMIDRKPYGLSYIYAVTTPKHMLPRRHLNAINEPQHPPEDNHTPKDRHMLPLRKKVAKPKKKPHRKE